MSVMLVNTYDSDETLSQNGYAMGASAMMTMMMTLFPPRCPQQSTGLFVICNPTLATEPDFAMLAYAPQRLEADVLTGGSKTCSPERVASVGQHGRVAMATNLPHTACLINPPNVSTETFASAAPPATVRGRDLQVWDLHKGVGPPPSCCIVVREVEKRFCLLCLVFLYEHSVAL